MGISFPFCCRRTNWISLFGLVVLLGALDVRSTGQVKDKSGCTFSSGPLKACKGQNETEKECEAAGCCYLNDTQMKTRKAMQNCMQQPTKVSKKNESGVCLHYNGLVCKPFMTNRTGNNTKHFIDIKYGVNGTDSVMFEFMKVVATSVRKPYCKKVIPVGICNYAIPPCNKHNQPIPICREDCDELTRRCSDDLERILGAVEYIVKLKKINFTHLVVPDCEKLKYSHDYSPAKPGSCRLTGLYDHSKKTEEEEENQKLLIIIAASVGGGILLMIIVVILVVCCRRSSRINSKDQTDLEFISVYTTIRDRLRQDSAGADPLLEAMSRKGSQNRLIQYPVDKVEYIRDLGEGQFGRVFQGRISVSKTNTEEETMVAVKVLKEGSSVETKEAFNQEVALMSVLYHRNILRLLAVSTEEEPFCMIFEFMEFGDLNKFLRDNDPERKTTEPKREKVAFKVEDFISMGEQVAAGMDYLSAHHFVHRDLATRNCLVGKDLSVKIADFGMSRDIYASDYYRVAGEAMLPIRWMPPEAILYGKFTIESDVFSYGILLWEIFTYALQPYYGYSNEEVIGFIKKGVLLPRPSLCPESVYDVMIGCWHREPDQRLNFSDVVQKLKESKSQGREEKPTTEVNELYCVPRSTVPSEMDTSQTGKKSDAGSDHGYFNLKGSNHMHGEEDIHDESVGFSDEPSTLLPKKTKQKSTGEENQGFSNSAYDPQRRQSNEHELYLVPRSILPPKKKKGDRSPVVADPTSTTEKRNGQTGQVDTLDIPDQKEVDQILRKRYLSNNDVKKLHSLPRSGTPSLNSKEIFGSYQPAICPSPEFWAIYSRELKGEPTSESHENLFRRVISGRSFRPKRGDKRKRRKHSVEKTDTEGTRPRSVTMHV